MTSLPRFIFLIRICSETFEVALLTTDIKEKRPIREKRCLKCLIAFNWVNARLLWVFFQSCDLKKIQYDFSVFLHPVISDKRLIHFHRLWPAVCRIWKLTQQWKSPSCGDWLYLTSQSLRLLDVTQRMTQQFHRGKKKTQTNRGVVFS